MLDVACGSKMFWFDRADDRAIFVDKRKLKVELKDKSSVGGKRILIIDPDLQCDFTNLPFQNESFPLVVFDPPHLLRNGKNGWLAKKYGNLGVDWREDIRRGFAECFRVLKLHGTLIFKWNEWEIPLKEILLLTAARPLFGNKCGRQAKTHWIVFQKENHA